MPTHAARLLRWRLADHGVAGLTSDSIEASGIDDAGHLVDGWKATKARLRLLMADEETADAVADLLRQLGLSPAVSAANFATSVTVTVTEDEITGLACREADHVDVTVAPGRQKPARAQPAGRQEAAACGIPDCDAELAVGSDPRALYCSAECRAESSRRRKRERMRRLTAQRQAQQVPV